MAGHSQFKNIMFRKGAQDAKRAKRFTRLGREIIAASRLGGPDPDANPRLRAAIIDAKRSNMPKDRIERAVQQGSGGGDGIRYEEIRYEGYGPGGVAIMVEAVTDNRNRTAAEIRSLFNKSGGNLGETGSVNFLFERVGDIRYLAEAATADAMFEGALEAGAEDVESGDEAHVVNCPPGELHTVAETLEERFGAAESVRLIWRPTTTVEVDRDGAENLFRLIDALEEADDVQDVSANAELSDEAAAGLEA